MVKNKEEEIDDIDLKYVYGGTRSLTLFPPGRGRSAPTPRKRVYP